MTIVSVSPRTVFLKLHNKKRSDQRAGRYYKTKQILLKLHNKKRSDQRVGRYYKTKQILLNLYRR